MAKKEKFYVVWRGNRTGIFPTWEDCKAAIRNFPKAQYKSFPTFEQAKEALEGDYKNYVGKKVSTLSKDKLQRIGKPNYHSISVVEIQAP